MSSERAKMCESIKNIYFPYKRKRWRDVNIRKKENSFLKIILLREKLQLLKLSWRMEWNFAAISFPHSHFFPIFLMLGLLLILYFEFYVFIQLALASSFHIFSPYFYFKLLQIPLKLFPIYSSHDSLQCNFQNVVQCLTFSFCLPTNQPPVYVQ